MADQPKANDGFTLFGFEIKRKGDDKKDKKEEKLVSFVAPNENDAIDRVINVGGYFGHYVDIDGSGGQDERETIYRYRDVAYQPECDTAVEEITDEAIVSTEGGVPVSINVDDLDQPDKIKKAIREEFEHILEMLNFSWNGHEIFRRWYIDGRLYYHKIVDEKDLKKGILELRNIDPVHMKKVREIKREEDPKTKVQKVTEVNEYFVYQNDTLVKSGQGVKISKDAITYVTSGITDPTQKRVLSHLHKALKPVNNLRMMEDSLVIYRLARAPERRVFYIDVGNLTTSKAEQYMKSIMAKHKNKIVYDAKTGEMRDEKKHMCLAMDTKIPLLDGRTLTLEQIASEFNSGKTLWAYSCDPLTGKFKPGIISWAGVTRKDAPVMRLTLDNGKTIVCTPEHKFPVWNKGFVRADELCVGESMVPHYTKMEKLGTKTHRYEQIFDNERQEWVFTHREVSKWKDESEIENEFCFNEDYSSADKNTVHHININPTDNTPDNLVKMNSKDHFKLHGAIGTNGGKIGGKRSSDLGVGMFNKENPDYRDWKVKAGRKGGKVSSELGRSHENYKIGREKLAELMQDSEWNSWFRDRQRQGWDDEKRLLASDRATKNQLSQIGNAAKQEAFKDKNSAVYKKHQRLYKTEYTKEIIDNVLSLAKNQKTINEVVNTLNNRDDLLSQFSMVNEHKVITQKAYDKFNKDDIYRIIRLAGFDSYNELKIQGDRKNHKIVSIEFLSETMDTGCLTIDGNEEFHDYHTFALDAGIYTQNSMLEDFWLPRREGGRGTEVTTLSGGENLSSIEDIIFFQRKLYKSLNVPLSRLEEQDRFSLGRASEITREELKFHKFIARLRKKFSHLFLDILKTQLILKSIINEDDWADISQKIYIDYQRDNHFYELKNIEVLQDRIRMAQDLEQYVGRFYSNKWIRKNILMQDEQEIEAMDKEIKEEGSDVQADDGDLGF